MIRQTSRIAQILSAFLFLILCGCSRADAPPAQPQSQISKPTALDEYVARAEPNYKWTKGEERNSPLGSLTALNVTSQTWQGRDWTHRVEIVRPQKVEFPDTALVLASYGSQEESMIAQLVARQIGAPVINVFGIPNQPLWDMREDDLIAHTFQKFLETGDTTWPLLLPMTKSVVKAMDAVQEYSRQDGGKPIEKFVVSGASKRGWTAWLVAAADSRLHPNRVTGIIPLVYNNLNIPKQMPYQLESWGKFSAQIEDYTRRGLQQHMSTPRGQELVAMVDPYFYRDRLTMPKLLVNGTNDPYWTPDATRFYLNDLPGTTNLYWAPNSGHDLQNDFLNVLNTTVAWFRLVVSGGEPPLVTKELAYDGEILREVNFIVDGQGNQGKFRKRYWRAFSDTRDFRDAQWTATLCEQGDGNPGGGCPVAAAFPEGNKSKFAAVFLEVEFQPPGQLPLRVSSPLEIWAAPGSR